MNLHAHTRLLLTAALLAVALGLLAACGNGGESTSGQATEPDAPQNGGADSEPSAPSGAPDDSDDGTVSYRNPGAEGRLFDSSRNDALASAAPANLVTWGKSPTISAGGLEANGMLTDGAMLFDPMADGDGAAFIVYYKGNEEPLVVLLPDLGPMFTWETIHTVAPMEHEFEGASFTFTAYSPLFMDVGPGDLELRVYGVDGTGADALLAVAQIAVQ